MKKEPAAKKADDPAATWDRFVDMARHVVNVPKDEVDRRERAYRKRRGLSAKGS